MCNCGCNTCETKIKGPLLTESKVKSLLSEGLQYHIDKKIPLFETVYRIGSDKHLALIKEARKMYSRNIIDLCEDDEALIKTHLGEFALYEGVSVPLDLPMLNESKIPTQDQVDKFFALTQNEMHYLNSKPVMGQEKTFNKMEVEPWDEYDLSNWNALVRKAKSKGQLNEGRAIITFKNDYEVKMNTGEGYDDDFEYFEAGEREQVYILDKNDKRVHVEFGDGTNAFIPSNVISVQEKSLNEFSLPKFDVVKPIIDKFLGGVKKAGEKLLKTVKREGKQTLVLVKEIAEYVISGEKPSPAEQKKITEQLKDLGFLAFLGIAGNIPFSLFSLIYWIIDESDIANEFLKLNESLNEDEQLDEKKKAKKKEKKDPPLNKPKRGGSKAYYVYVRDPKTKKIKKVSFGSGGLRAKIKNKEARNAFAKRHRCKDKKDRTKAGYWSCNLPRYAPALGLGAKMNTFW